MNRFLTSTASGVAALACTASAWAHPGHGTIPAEEPAHWLEPAHLLPILGAAAVVSLAMKYARRRGEERTR
jgi:hypothetical protein